MSEDAEDESFLGRLNIRNLVKAATTNRRKDRLNKGQRPRKNIHIQMIFCERAHKTKPVGPGNSSRSAFLVKGCSDPNILCERARDEEILNNRVHRKSLRKINNRVETVNRKFFFYFTLSKGKTFHLESFDFFQFCSNKICIKRPIIFDDKFKRNFL